MTAISLCLTIFFFLASATNQHQTNYEIYTDSSKALSSSEEYFNSQFITRTQPVLANVTTLGSVETVIGQANLDEVAYSPIFIFMCIVYTISTLSAIITNLIVLLVYMLGHNSKTELSIFLINLALADFLMSTVCMPFTFAQALLKRWIFGEIMCPIGKLILI